MGRTRKRKLTDLDGRRDGARSPLFRYMRANYKELVKIGVGTRGGPKWDDVASFLMEQGLRNRDGGPLVKNNVRQLFAVVAAEMASKAARAAKASAPQMLPPTRSQVPVGWQPTPTTPRSPRSPQPAQLEPPPPPADTTGETEAEAEARTEANIARLMRHIDEASGRITPRRTNS